MSFVKQAEPLQVEAGQFIVRVAKVTAGAAGAQPSYAGWMDEPRLQVLYVYYGSSLVGGSYAKLKAATGQPFTTQIDVEDSPMLNRGDRVAIGLQGAGGIQWLFVGYMVQGELAVEDDAEALVYRCAGPEWAWGGNSPRSGCDQPMYGQVRRRADADDAYAGDHSSVTQYAKMIVLADEPAVFNPDGRRNMTTQDVQLAAPAGAPITGRAWELLDRKDADTAADLAAFWDKAHAAHTLLTVCNNPQRTGIDLPSLGEISSVISTSSVLRSVSVDGLTLWGALQRVIEPEYGFYVDPRPGQLTGGGWAGCEVRFFSRASGPAAGFTLDPRGTSMANASPCVARVQAVKALDKVVNKVVLTGRGLRHVRLMYRGNKTPDAAWKERNLSLQHGWKTDQGDLSNYADTATANVEIDAAVIDQRGKTQEWQDRYCVGGKEFNRYAHVFRLFTWNEAGELRGTGPKYGQTTAHSWYTPDLTKICDAQGFDPDANPGAYARRRRRCLDTPFLSKLGVDGWLRDPVTLYVAGFSKDDGKEPTNWRKMPEGSWRLDPERAAIWITYPDLTKLLPLKEQAQAAATQPAVDGRNFATLLYSGDLRLMLECCVEADGALVHVADRQAISGAPQPRQMYVRGGADFTHVLSYDDGQTSPSGATPDLVNQRADAQTLAEQLREAGQDEQVHASLLVEADYPLQQIGSMISSIGGRGINLTSTSGRGAQVVAIGLDPDAMKYEYLTESAALELRKLDRVRLASKRHRSRAGGRTDHAGLPQAAPGQRPAAAAPAPATRPAVGVDD